MEVFSSDRKKKSGVGTCSYFEMNLQYTDLCRAQKCDNLENTKEETMNYIRLQKRSYVKNIKNIL